MKAPKAGKKPVSSPGPRRTPAELRQAIVDAALTVFARNGYEGASTREIAEEAHVEVGHLAYYFRTKEDMWTEVVREYALPNHELLKGLVATADLRRPKAAARQILPQLLRTFAENHRLTRLMLQDFSVASSRHDRAVWEVGRPVWLHLQPLFESLQAEKGGRTDDAKLVYFAMVGSALLFFGSSPEVKQITGLDPTDRAAADAYIDLVVASVLRSATVRSAKSAPGSA